MTEIAGIAAVNNGQRVSSENEEQRFSIQQNQTKIKQADLADHRLDQAKSGANDADAKNLDPASDNIQDAQATGQIQFESFAQGQIEQEEQAVKVSLSDAAQLTQNQVNQTTPKDVNSAEQNITQKTETELGTDKSTQVNNDNRKREDTSNVESRQTRELGRVLDTFAWLIRAIKSTVVITLAKAVKAFRLLGKK